MTYKNGAGTQVHGKNQMGDEWKEYYREVTEDMGLGKDEVAKMLMDMYDSKNRSWMYASDEEDLEITEAYYEDEESVDAEYATILMDELTENGLDSHILLKYPKIADWWGGILKERKKKAEALRKREEARRKKEEDARARESLLARLTPEEKRLLGVK